MLAFHSRVLAAPGSMPRNEVSPLGSKSSPAGCSEKSHGPAQSNIELSCAADHRPSTSVQTTTGAPSSRPSRRQLQRLVTFSTVPSSYSYFIAWVNANCTNTLVSIDYRHKPDLPSCITFRTRTAFGLTAPADKGEKAHAIGAGVFPLHLLTGCDLSANDTRIHRLLQR